MSVFLLRYAPQCANKTKNGIFSQASEKERFCIKKVLCFAFALFVEFNGYSLHLILLLLEIKILNLVRSEIKSAAPSNAIV